MSRLLLAVAALAVVTAPAAYAAPEVCVGGVCVHVCDSCVAPPPPPPYVGCFPTPEMVICL